MKYIIDMPEGWNPKIEDGIMVNCPISQCEAYLPCHDCPLINSKKAIEVKIIEDDECGCGVVDKKGRFYYADSDTLYATSKEKLND